MFLESKILYGLISICSTIKYKIYFIVEITAT